MPGPGELAIIALIALLIFGGSRLAGIGKSAGRAIREFKEETAIGNKATTEDKNEPPVVDAEVVDEPNQEP